MKNKYRFVVLLLVAIAIVSYAFTAIYLKTNDDETAGDGTLTVVTSFYPVYTAALNVFDGVDGVTLSNLSEPQTGCLHDYQLTPGDLKLLETADVFIVNGGGIESFLQDVAESNPKLTIVNISENLEFIEEEDETNAHAWMSVKLYKMQVQTMAEEMSKLNPDNAEKYVANAEVYVNKLDELMAYEEEVMNSANVIILQEAYEYLTDELGMNAAFAMDMDEERQISAGEVSDAITAVKDSAAVAILSDDLYGLELANTVSKETGAKVCIVSSLVRGDYDKDSYLNGMRENLDNISAAVK